MSLISLHGPDKEPVSLSEVKAYLRIDGDEDDLLLENMIKAARQMIEVYTTRSLMIQSWRYTLKTQSGIAFSDAHYVAGYRTRGQRGIELPRSPFIKLISHPVLMEGKEETSIESYRLDTAGRIARIHFHGLLLDYYSSGSMIQIDFQAGYGKDPNDLPEPLRQAILMTVADLHERPLCSNDNGWGKFLLNSNVVQLIRPFKVMRLA